MTQNPLRTGWRLLRVATTLVLAAGLAACAGLPRDVQRVPSQALPASSDTELGRIAAASVPAQVSAVSAMGASLSGFRLLSWPAQSLYARIELARRAQRSLDLQYYELRDDETGRLLLRTLRDAAQRGVRVRLLLDDLYTAGSDPVLSGLAAFPNVEVRLFNPFPMGAAAWARGSPPRCSTLAASTTACTTSCSSPTVRWRWLAAATSPTSTSWWATRPTTSTSTSLR